MVHIYTLNNGIRVVTEPVDNYRSVAFGLWIDAGSANETKENNGIAHVIEHMLFKGTRKRNARMLADDIAAIGGDLDAYTTREYTCFSAHTLDKHLKRAINIIADMVTDSLITEEDLKKELGVILEEIDMYEDDPEELIGDLLHQAVWKDQSMGFLISGNKENVRRFCRQDVLDFMSKYYVGCHMIISIAGHFNEKEILQEIESKFGGIPSGTNEASIPVPQYFQSMVFKQKALEQLHLCMAFPCIPFNDQQQYIYYIVDNIVGSNQSSRLFQEIREEKGLTYSIYSYSSSYKKCGIFQIYAAVNPGQIMQVLNALSKTFLGLKTKPVNTKELELTKAQIETELMIAAESTESRMESNGEALIYRTKIDTLDKILKDIDAVTIAQVHQFIDQYMIGVQPSICIVGDLNQIDCESVKKWRLYEQ